MNEYAEKYVATGFTLGNPPYHVFSSYDANTTQVHFRWMSEYGIDGVFVQRFGSDFGVKNFLNTVLTNCKTRGKYVSPQVCYHVRLYRLYNILACK